MPVVLDRDERMTTTKTTTITTTTIRNLNVLFPIALCLVAARPAVADNDVIEHCRQTSSADDRIACLEAAILVLTGSPGTDTGATGPAVATAGGQPSPAEAEAPQPAATDVRPQPGETEAPPVAAAAAPASAVPPETPPPSAGPDAAPRAADASTTPADEIGAAQVEARAQTREQRLANLEEAHGLKVERFERVGYRQLQVRLENGQIWRQIRGDDQEIRVTVERNPTVDITESSLGGFRLRLNEIRRTIRVRRIR